MLSFLHGIAKPLDFAMGFPDNEMAFCYKDKEIVMKCRALDWVALVLVIIGAINWGLVGLFNFNLIHAIFGEVLSRIIFVIVGLAGVWMIYYAVKCGKCCSKTPPTMP